MDAPAALLPARSPPARIAARLHGGRSLRGRSLPGAPIIQKHRHPGTPNHRSPPAGHQPALLPAFCRHSSTSRISGTAPVRKSRGPETSRICRRTRPEDSFPTCSRQHPETLPVGPFRPPHHQWGFPGEAHPLGLGRRVPTRCGGVKSPVEKKTRIPKRLRQKALTESFRPSTGAAQSPLHLPQPASLNRESANRADSPFVNLTFRATVEFQSERWYYRSL